MSKITAIQEVKNFRGEESAWSSYDGYLIKTEEGDRAVLISNGQSCCESWGYLSSQEDLSYFVGADLIKFEVVQENLLKVVVGDTYEGGAIFVDVHTSLGVFQLAAYNSHNGYYGHTVLIINAEGEESFGV